MDNIFQELEEHGYQKFMIYFATKSFTRFKIKRIKII